MAVLEVYNNNVSHLDKGEHTAEIFLDLSKAFDTISHNILVTELQHYGVRGSALDWFRNYLKDRKQYDSFNNWKSNIGIVQFGVPQGAVFFFSNLLSFLFTQMTLMQFCPILILINLLIL